MTFDQPLTEPTRVTRDPVPAAAVRHHGVRMDQLRDLFDAGFSALAASGAALAGPAFAVYRGDLHEAFDLDIGFPVAQPLGDPITVGGLTVEASELPGGDLLGFTHVGPYDALPQSWGVLAQAAQDLGLAPSAFFEVYVTEPSPEVDPATLRTDLYLMLSGV